MCFKKCILLLTAVVSAMALSACGKSKEALTEPTPTPTVTAAPTDQLTPTASPTDTPAAATTDTSTAETTDTSADTSADTTASGDLSEDLYSFQFSLNGTVYTLPCAYSQLAENGWSIDGIGDQTLEPDQYTFSENLNNGDMRVMANLVNTDVNVLPMEKCNVGKISIDSDQVEKGAKLLFPKNITVGSTYEDVVAAYGKPSDESESGSIKSLSYKLDTYSDVVIKINTESNTVDSLEMENLIAKETSSASVNTGDVPDVVKNYTAPTSVGKTWDSFDIKYADAYYHLPAPVSSFIDNGWTMVSDGNEMLAAKDSTVGVELRKDNQVLSASVRNYSDTAQPISNCFLISVKFSEYEAKVSIELPKGITETSKSEDIIAAYGKPTDKDSSSSFDFYEYSNSDGSITFSISKDTKGITSIEVNNDPKSPY
jgi:hypothetical protein